MPGAETKVLTAVERIIHQGKIVEAGDDLEVLAHDAERLVRNGVAEAKRSAGRGKSKEGE